MADAHKNFAYSTIGTAPSPATSGTSLVVASGEGARFPTAPFNATVWPAGAQALASNAEIVRVTAVSTDTLTITRAQEGTSARTVVAGDQILAGITVKTLTDVEGGSLRDRYVRPTFAQYETVTRGGQVNSSQALASGTLNLIAIALPAGLVVSTITFVTSTTAASGPTNQWFGLYDSSRVQLALTANQTTTAWAANTAKTLNIATTAAGSASSFTTTYEGLYYLGIMVSATTTAPNLACAAILAVVSGLTPVISLTSDTAQTTPPAFPHTATAGSTAAVVLYATVG